MLWFFAVLISTVMAQQTPVFKITVLDPSEPQPEQAAEEPAVELPAWPPTKAPRERSEPLELMVGASVYHFFTKHTGSFKTQWSEDGRWIGTPVGGLGVMQTDGEYYQTQSYYIGENSVGGGMAGFLASTGKVYSNWNLGAVAGLYLQDSRKFTADKISTVAVPMGDSTSVMPLVGFEAVYKIEFDEDFYLKIHNVITPILGITYLSIPF